MTDVAFSNSLSETPPFVYDLYKLLFDKLTVVQVVISGWVLIRNSIQSWNNFQQHPLRINIHPEVRKVVVRQKEGCNPKIFIATRTFNSKTNKYYNLLSSATSG